MDTNIILGILNGFREGYEFGEAIDNLISNSPHLKKFNEAHEILQNMMVLEDFTPSDFACAKKAIRLLNTVDSNDKRYLQFQALYMKSFFYALLSHYDKCYECLDNIEAMDDGNLFTVNRRSIKEIKEDLNQFRQTVQEAEQEYNKEKEEKEKAEKEKKEKEEDLYNRVMRIDNTLQTIKDGITQPIKSPTEECRYSPLLGLSIASIVLSATAIVLLCILLSK